MEMKRQVVSSSGAQLDTASIVKRFDTPEKVLVFDDGRLELITVGGRLIGKGSYGPRWKWSHSAKGLARGGERPPEHVGVVLSGRAKVVIADSREIDLTPGDFFHIACEYESWVVGYRPCEVLYISGVEALIGRLQREW